ncbi:MAG: MBL fold metallo-hydrolase [Desulfuromonadales bacterium]
MQITPQVHQLTIPFSVPTPAGPLPRSVNVFLLPGQTLTLVDSGVAGAEEQIFSYLGFLGRSPEEIDRLLLTHSHPDHIGAARSISDVTGCRVSAHPAERDWIEDTELQERERPVPGFRALVAGPVPVRQLLPEGKRVDLPGSLSLKVLHTPGHSPGSVSLWSEPEGILFCGDALPVPGDLPIFTDFAATVHSLERLRSLEISWLLSAWDRPRWGGEGHACIEEGLEWLEKIRKVVTDEATAGEDRLALCRRVVLRLGLPPSAANPLVALSFLACLRA